jgi:hypothetical protein
MRLALPLLATLCALGLSACGDTLQVQPIPHQDLEGLVVAPFPIYWLGASFRGLAVSETFHDPSDAYAVSYGNCIQGGQGYCVPPLRIVTSPDNSFVPGGSLPTRTQHIRGVSAQLAQGGKTILIATGGVVVDIYADNASLARAAADGLAPINTAGSPGETLPARTATGAFEAQPLPTQVPNPLHPLGVPLGRG